MGGMGELAMTTTIGKDSSFEGDEMRYERLTKKRAVDEQILSTPRLTTVKLRAVSLPAVVLAWTVELDKRTVIDGFDS